MTRKISNWVTRGAQELRELGPYAPYALAAILPGGSIIAAVVWLYRHSRGRSASLRNLSRTLSIVVALVSLVLLPGCVSSAGLTALAHTTSADHLAVSQTLSGEPVA